MKPENDVIFDNDFYGAACGPSIEVPTIKPGAMCGNNINTNITAGRIVNEQTVSNLNQTDEG